MPAFPWRFRNMVLAAALPALVTAAVAIALVSDVDEEYARRVKKLAPDDIAGHLELAMWCKEQKAWALLRDECAHILRQNPNHQQAELLLKLAKAKLAKQQPGEGAETSPGPEDVARAGEFARIITEKEIQILRRAELSQWFPERVRVKFLNDVVNRFADERFGVNRQGRVRFMRLGPADKAQMILASDIADRFAKDILITSDPQLFADFERWVLPVITRGCATPRCHGGPNAVGFRLFTGRRLTKNQVYTNYLILNEYKKGPKGELRLINRDNRAHSLLLFYGHEPPPASELTPPRHPIEIEPIYRSVQDPKYQRVAQWIQSLDVVAPEYGIDIKPAAQSE